MIGYNEVYIIGYARTPIGSFNGSLAVFSAVDLGKMAVKEALRRTNIPNTNVQELIMGNAISSGCGQNVARQVAIKAGLSTSTPCSTVNRVCSSGLKAVGYAFSQIRGGLDVIVAGGTESMSNIPHYLYARSPRTYGNQTLHDGLIKDGLTDAFDNSVMGIAAERVAEKYKISRTDQDDFAILSYMRSQKYQEVLQKEIVPVSIAYDEETVKFKNTEAGVSKLKELKPVFLKENGTVTAANSSSLSDGAAALVLVSQRKLTKYHGTSLFQILAYTDVAQDPIQFPTSPSLAIKKALKMCNLSIDQVDYFEINEAFASVVLANIKILGIDAGKVNKYGGAVSMGHPLGCSGARILCTLCTVLISENASIGVAAICNGGGGASCCVIRRVTQ